MDDVLVVIAVLILGTGGILGIAYSLDVRRKKHGPLGPELPRCGRCGRYLLWGARILVVLLVASIACAYAYRMSLLGWITLGLLVLFVADGLAYPLVRLTGK